MSSTWTDTQTSLMWTLLPQSYSQKDAQNACAQLRVDGHADWRLPNLGELKSLLKAGASRPIVGLSKGSEFYWTGTAFDTDQYSFYGVNPQGQQDDFAATSVQAVLAVRISTLDAGVWTDPKTGLMWARVSIGQRWENGKAVGEAQAMLWDAAREAARNYRLAGFKDWRLPNIEELKSIAITGQAGTNAPQGVLLPSTISGTWGVYWSASPNTNINGYAWYVNFLNGYSHYNLKNLNGYVRAVRAGQ